MPDETTLFEAPEKDSEGISLTSRRGFLGTGAALAATGIAATALSSRTAEAQRAPYGSLIERLGQRAEWKDLDLRLVRRITLGLTAADVAAVKSLGFSRYLEEQLNADAIDDSAAEARISSNYPQFFASQATLLANENFYWRDYAMPIRRAIMERAIFSKRQLKERMTEFWMDHFNIADSAPRVVDYRDVIQQHALGNFGAMVRASMRSPAMLIYLDQVYSSRFGVNENYARELLELHTVSPDGGYVQSDVRDFARVLTGWTIDQNRNFLYRADYHDFGAKTVMGVTFPSRPRAGGTAGMDEAISFAEHLIAHPATARFIATKLLMWFIRPDPSAAQINAVMAAYTSSGGDIKAMLRVVLTPNNLANSPAKLKRPFHYYVSAARATGVTIDPWTTWGTYEGVAGSLWDLAHQIFDWPTPDGYPDRAEYWAGLMVNRWNAITSMISNWGQVGQYPRFDPATFAPSATPVAVVDEINRRMFGGEMTASLRTELTNWCSAGTLHTTRIRNAVYFAACAPEFQYY